MNIGQRILLALKTTGRTQADLARYLKTSPSTVKGWIREGRVPAADVILPICDFLGVSPIWMLSDDESAIRQKGSKEELSKLEKSLLSAYSQKPEMQEAVNRILGIYDEESDSEYVYVLQASDSCKNVESGVVKMLRSDVEKLRTAKPIKRI